MHGEFRHHLARLQAAAVDPQKLDQAGRAVEQGNVLFDRFLHVGAQDLDRAFAPAGQHGEMHLRDGRARHRLRLELLEHFGHRPAEGTLQLGVGEFGRKRRHLVLQPRELVGDVGGQQVAPRGQHLAELDEQGPQGLEREAQAHCARLGQPAPEQHALHRHEQKARARVGEHELIQAEADADADDSGEAQEALQFRG